MPSVLGSSGKVASMAQRGSVKATSAKTTQSAPARATPAHATATQATSAPAKDATPTAPQTNPTAPDSATPSLLTTTRQLAADQKLLTSLDERISDRRQLAEVYGKWNEVVASQATTVMHAGLLSVTIVIVILLLLVFVDQWLERLVGRMKLDRRQVETLRSVARVSLQILSIVVILLVLVGMPTQLATMLGIVGCGAMTRNGSWFRSRKRVTCAAASVVSPGGLGLLARTKSQRKPTISSRSSSIHCRS